MIFDFSKYGANKKTDPDYWMKTSQYIWNDNGLTIDEKMSAQEQLVQEYQKEKRDKTARDKARRGEFPLGEPTKEQLEQELFSLLNKKPAFRTPKDKARIIEIRRILNQ